MAMSQVLEAVKKRSRPRRAAPQVKEMLKKVKDLVKASKIKAKVEVGGSFAKGTNLRDDFDVDIFIRFDLSYADEDLSEMLEKILKPLKPRRVHGSRDYFQLTKEKGEFEFIPVLDIHQTNQAMNVTDCSPLHTKWFLEHGKELQDEVRLAKLFCKAHQIYGAESYIRGFSGHTLDILIVHYGGFVDLLNAAVKWKRKTVVDPENAHQGKALRRLNASKIEGPLVVIDPIEPFRNAASGLGEEKYLRFKEAAKDFLRDPRKDHFVVTPFVLEEITQRFPHVLAIDVVGVDGKKDVVGSKILKVFETLRDELHEFGMVESGWVFDKSQKATLWYGVAKILRDKEVVVQGPPLTAKSHASQFKKKHKKVFEQEGRLYAKTTRDDIEIKKVVGQILKRPHLKERMTRCSVKLHS